MRAKIVTTITTELDLDTLEPTHAVHVDDVDGLSEISSDIVGGLLLGALGATGNAVREKYPHAAHQFDTLLEQAEGD